MSEPASPSWKWLPIAGVAAIALVAAGAWWFFHVRDTWILGEALAVALRPAIEQQGTDQAMVARAILDNYLETRSNAARWSGVYWGFTFVAAALSALAGLILKFESFIKNESAKKDIAALLAVGAALLITISTSGDFQRKWQANRIAAAELERTGYELLEGKAADPRTHLASVGQILHRRHMAIVGGTEQRGVVPEAAKGSPQAK
jgi:hypothetical protein